MKNVVVMSAMAAAVTCQSAMALDITPLGDYRTGLFDEGGAEIVDFHPSTNRMFVVNGGSQTIDMVDISNPDRPFLARSIDITPYGANANSVAVVGRQVVAAVEANLKQAKGSAVFFDFQGNFQSSVKLCALPDMVTATPNGRHILFACEGEPNSLYNFDPAGMVAILDVSEDGVVSDAPRFVDFTALDRSIPEGMHWASPQAKPSDEVEPEYIAVSHNSRFAWVSLQENNAIAIVDILEGELIDVKGMGFKDHMEFPLDASNRDDAINIHTWPVHGMYQPDTIHAIHIAGNDYILTANEGDARDYDAFSEETRVKDVTLDADAFPNADMLQQEENLGRLKITNTRGDTDGDGDFDVLYSYGARSFSILNGNADMIWDSGSEIEERLARLERDNFNSTNDENGSFDDRSDDKGPEPEGITAGYVGTTPYAFIGLERVGGFMVYDLTNPYSPKFVSYHNDRDFNGNPENDTAGELAPEGMTFVTAEDSPTGNALLLVASEVSGSTKIHELK